MSITSVKSGATGISLALDNNFMEPIATTLVGSGGVNQVTFLDIPQTYKHLQIRGIALSASTPRIYIRYNGDGASNYTYHFLEGNGSSAVASAGANQTENWLFINGFIASSTPSPFVVDILDYANSNKFKTIRSLHGGDNNSAGNIALCSGLWRDTTAITSIQLFTSSSTFSQHSRFSLYGIKG